MSEFHFAKPSAPARAVLLAQLGLILVIAFSLMLVWSMLQSRADQARDYRDVIAQRDILMNSETALDRSGVMFFEQDTPQLAQAEFTDTLQALAEAYEIELEVLQAEEVARVNGMVQLTMVISGAVPEARLGDFLSALANARPVILADDMSLRRARILSRRVQDRKVAFQLDLKAFMEG